MVTILREGHSMTRIVNYNEDKIKENVAECIVAANFTGDLHRMSSKFRRDFMLHQLTYNLNAKCNTVHITLSFAPSESHLQNDKLAEIADQYMEQIGFGKQPYLVYRHYDAGHPHLHVVTTNVQTNGKLISLHRLGVRESEPARKALEEKYGLVRAEDQNRTDDLKAKLESVKKAIYGSSGTKRAIQIVLGAVVDRYRYTSLAELNAVLGIYNVRADRGTENSRVFQRNGLLYRVLDEKGNAIGVPVKASVFAGNPILKNLEENFKVNQTKRSAFMPRVKNAIDIALLGSKVTLNELIDQLQRQGIQTILRTSEDGRLYGLTYIDHTTRCVFNGSNLGKQYSAKAIQERCRMKDAGPSIPDHGNSAARKFTEQFAGPHKTVDPTAQKPETSGAADGLLAELFRAEQTADFAPGQHKRKRRKKRKNSSTN